MKRKCVLASAALIVSAGLSTRAQAQVAQEPGYTLDYQLNVPSSASFNGGAIPYAVNNSASIPDGLVRSRRV